MDDRVCDFLREVDENFNNGGVNVVKFNRFKKCHSYCPRQTNSKENKCTNDYERTNALGSYLFKKISEIDKAFKEGSNSDKRHIEIFMMWLGEKLFRIDNDYKSTLEESYIKNLEKYMGSIDYWKITDSKKLYKKATIKKMSEYYGLLNYICKLIIEYNTYIQNPKKHNRNRIGTYSSQCDNFYKTIHNSINDCGPYLQLLDSLKMIFEVFRIQKIVNNYDIKEPNKTLLLNRVKSLTTFQNVNKYFVTVNPTISFDDKECLVVKSNDEQIGEKIALTKSKNPVRVSQTQNSGNKQHGNPGSPQPKQPPAQPPPLKPPSGKLKLPHPSPAKPVAVKPEPPPQSSPSQTNNELKAPQEGKTHQNGQGGTVNGADGGKGDAGSGVNGGGSVQGNQGSKSGASSDGSQGSSKTQTGSDIGTGSLGGDPGGAAGGKGGSNSNPGVKNSGSGVSEGGTSSGASGGQDGIKVGSNDVSGGKVDGKGSTSGEKGGKSSGSVVAQGDQGGSSGGSDDGSGGTGSGPGGQTKHSRNLPQGNPVPAPSGTGTIPPMSASTLSSQPVQSPTGSQSPPVSQPSSPQPSMPNVPTPKDPATLPKPQPDPKTDPKPQVQQPTSPVPAPPQNDPASNTSGGSFNLLSPFLGFIFNGTNKFNQASQFIEKNRQNFENAKNKISDAYNNTVDNLKNAYNASSDYLNKFINNVTSQLNQVGSPSKSGDKQSGSGSPSDGGNSSNQPPSPQPSSTTDPTDPSNPPTPTKDPAPTTPPTTPMDPALQKQSSPQPQHITPQPPQIGPFIQKTPGKAISQLVKSLSSNPNLKKTWNIFPTTWNGSGDCKPEIKFINATLVCCTSEQCSLTGILITIVLIPIILSIAYKYLSFGSSKKSEKKNMKRVINFHDGNRKTKIIISSNNRNKDLKPVINSVGRKKDSLLNIYKHIRADPMPFINLFFLLIFFVYKRKRNTIE
ncbi:PIR protein CIR protein [Plasmodium vinckei brucechwatti]|uniref:PIR protein CIR protein n=1 Tax=Plasmodium vinckei brucechwatti TaxID=119398 RepID=A0A6V7SGV0_PLAVN|nr:PIR protein CIR protein [Plasmodium vinckei brucechwatti]